MNIKKIRDVTPSVEPIAEPEPVLLSIVSASTPSEQLHPFIFDADDAGTPLGARDVRCRWHHAMAVRRWLYDRFATVSHLRNDGGTSGNPQYAVFRVTNERKPA